MNMEPFGKIPAELRLQILVTLGCKNWILQLIQASPAMLGQYVTSKAYIIRTLLSFDLDDEMVQDAMAIVLFPSLDTGNNHESLALDHFGSWRRKQLPNPLKTHNYRLLDELDKLHSRLLLFIEDYLTKATAIFPPREYLCLPELSSVRRTLTFKDQIVRTRFDSSHLTLLERKRLLRAFLQYELRCKINPFWTGHDNHISAIPDDITSLYNYGNQELHQPEREAIYCVYKYVEYLYGAMFAQCFDSWLPEIPTGSLSSGATGLLFPDTLYFNPRSYASDMGLENDHVHIAEFLAFFGFDLVTTFLRHATAGKVGRNHIKHWFKNSNRTDFIPWLLWAYDLCCFCCFCDDAEDIEENQYEKASGMYQLLRPRINRHYPLHKNIYRQRAWVFLDDARFYPSASAEPHFLTSDKLLAGIIIPGEGWPLGPGKERAVRRSRKWHDERRGVFSRDEGVQSSARETTCQDLLPTLTEEKFSGTFAPFWR
ncbi:hypothetical protein FDECE_1645 [Fusarium decemcellulare]|nr:hypothetical protein FDECE_1645 [Fusarium decemcellulare]